MYLDNNNNTNMTIDPAKEIKKTLENFGPILCSFPDESLKTSPSLVAYCIIIALLWLFLIITLCVGYIRQIIDRIRSVLGHGQSNDRENNTVNEIEPEVFQGVLPIQQITPFKNYTIGNNSK
jgi:hypothetical protein